MNESPRFMFVASRQVVIVTVTVIAIPPNEVNYVIRPAANKLTS